MAQTGYTPIQLYYSTTGSQAPVAGNLANGELAINITDGKLYYKDNGGVVQTIAGKSGAGVVAGSNTQIQYNNNGVFGASSNLTYDGTTLYSASNTLIGTTTNYSSTTNAGSLALGGIGIYPYTTNAGATNSTISSTLNLENLTTFVGNNGTSSQSYYGIVSSPKISNTGAGGTGTNTAFGIFSAPTVQSSGAAARVLLTGGRFDAIRGNANDTSTSTSNGIVAVNGQAQHLITAGAGIVSASAVGGQFQASNQNGTITTAYGILATVNTASSTAALTASSTTAYQYYGTSTVGAASGGPGSVTTLYGFYNQLTVGATGTVTNYYGLYLNTPSVTGTLTNRWGVYQADTSATNFFGGNVGIGTTSPSARLHSAVSRTSGTNTVAFVLSDNVTGAQTPGFGTQIQALSNAGGAVSAIGFETGGSGTNNETQISFYTQNTAGGLSRKMVIDAIGNLGLSVTPSAWGVGKAIEVNALGSALFGVSGGGNTWITDNAYFDGSNWIRPYAKGATAYNLNSGTHAWNIAGSSTAGSTISFTQAMTLDASGNLGIGTTSPSTYGKFAVNVGNVLSFSSDEYSNALIATGTSANQNRGLNIQVGNPGSLSNSKGAQINLYGNTQDSAGFAGSVIIATAADSGITSSDGMSIVFRTGSSSTDRMRIFSGGGVAIGNTTNPGNKGISIGGAIMENVFTITDTAGFEIDPANGTVQLITLGASRTPKGTNFSAGESVTLMVDDGTAYTITWTDATFGSGGVKWVGGSAPTLATTGYTIIELWKISTQVYGALVGSA